MSKKKNVVKNFFSFTSPFFHPPIAIIFSLVSFALLASDPFWSGGRPPSGGRPGARAPWAPLKSGPASMTNIQKPSFCLKPRLIDYIRDRFHIHQVPTSQNAAKFMCSELTQDMKNHANQKSPSQFSQLQLSFQPDPFSVGSKALLAKTPIQLP
jgi:hypothetical protein